MPSHIKYSLSISVLAFALGGMPMQAQALSAERSAANLIAQDAGSLKMVNANSAQLRCGDQDVFYSISELDANTPLQALGTSGSYTKVLLPSSIGAFVPVNEVDATPDASVIILAIDSKLRAPSHLLGLSGSWKALFSTPLPSGTSLTVIETLLSDAGDILGYRVDAPVAPSGELAIAYIRTDALRDATSAEIAAFDPNAAPLATTTDPVADPVIDSDPEPAIEDANDEQSTEVDSSLIEDMNMPSSEPVEIENSAPVAVQEPESDPEAATESTRTAPSGRVSASALEDLEAAFDNARSLSKAELDEALNELGAEFSRTRAQAQEGSSLAAALDQRLEWIAIRIETRDQRRSIAAILAAYDANADQVAKDIAAWQAGRAYQLVGRMTTSAVYTGEHLPLLYRIQAIDPSSGASRTIGYVAPTSTQDYRHLLGRVVGIVGSMNNDDSLNLTIIVPDRIDPMPE